MEPSHVDYITKYYTPSYLPENSTFVINEPGNSSVFFEDERTGVLLGEHKLPDSCVVLCKGYITETFAKNLYESLDDYSYLQRRPIAYGNLQRRLNGMVGDQGIEGYKYSGTMVPCVPWSGPGVNRLPEEDQLPITYIKYIAQVMSFEFFSKANMFRDTDDDIGKVNTCLINYYRDGDDVIGKHSDNTAQMGVPVVALPGPKGPVPIVPPVGYDGDFVAILTLTEGKGEGVREMIIEDKHSKQRVYVSPDCGDLLLMLGKTQRYKTHEIPKDPNCKKGRKSLTFRAFKTY